jgi:hypothetical protein
MLRDRLQCVLSCGLVIAGLVAGAALRSRTAVASSLECGESETSELVEVRRIEGSGPEAAQAYWRRTAVIYGDDAGKATALFVFNDNSAEDGEINFNLLPEASP